MSELTCKQVYTVARSEVRACAVDLGENTAGQETGVLKNGDTVSSGTISVSDKPTGASDPTLSSVSVISTATWINGRQASSGEGVTFTITAGSAQTYGRYVLLLSVTTTNGETIKRRLLLDVGAE